MKNIPLSISRQDHHYQIFIGEEILPSPDIFNNIRLNNRVCIITNDTVAPLYLEQCTRIFGKHFPSCNICSFIIEDGEIYKSLESFERVSDFLIDQQFKRNDILVALGGGVIGDLTGFVASCYQRGIDFIQMPTTLLAMVDSSVGGKTAVNHKYGKNLIGAFHQPIAVFSDISVLNTLPKEEFSAGMAEVIKSAIIYDSTFFQWLVDNSKGIFSLRSDKLELMIQRACRIKAEIVEKDELEKGERALLNLGHTFGHAIENLLGYGNILHGEAVSIGIVLAARLSYEQQKVTALELESIISCLSLYKLPTELPPGISAIQMVDVMALDKKNLNRNLRLILPLGIGKATISEDSSIANIHTFLEQYESK